MAAQDKEQQHKILRIGIIRGGKIAEERLIKVGETVTVGEGDKNTFELPPSSLPKRFPMFQPKGPQYQLAFLDGMDGKISMGSQVVSLESLIREGKAQKKGEQYLFPLAEGNRGKVQIGDATILFQFVPAPPEPAKAAIESLGRFTIDREEMPFYGILLISCLLHLAALIWISNQPPSEKVSLEDLDTRVLRLVIPPRIPIPELPSDEVLDDGSGKKEEEKDPGVKAEKAKDESADPAPPAPEEPTEEQLRDKVAAQGLAAVLGTRGASSQNSAVADLLSDSGALSSDLDSALSRVGVIKSATRGSDTGGDALRGSKGGVYGGSGVGSGLSGGGTGGVAKAQTEVKPRLQVGKEDIAGGTADASHIRAVVNKKLPSIQACYEEQLRGNPELKGKVNVLWTIKGDGKVGEIKIQENSTGNQDMEECIRRRIRRWEFNPTQDGAEVEVSYPFIFVLGS